MYTGKKFQVLWWKFSDQGKARWPISPSYKRCFLLAQMVREAIHMKGKTTLLVALTVLAGLTIACGNRQAAQPVAQQMAQPGGPPTTQPLDKPSALTQPGGPPPATGQPADAVPPPAPNSAANYERVPSNAISIPAGTILDVRLEQTLDTKRNRAGDRFTATLTRPIILDGQTVIPRGTPCTGHLTESKPSGRFKGRAVMSLSLDSFELYGRHHEIRTTHVGRESGGHKKRNWAFIGGGSGAGAAIGALAGGPAGALIGAGAGAGAGTAGAAITGKKNVRLPVETPLAFSLRAPVTLAN